MSLEKTITPVNAGRRLRSILSLAVAAAAVLTLATSVAAIPPSAGVYRIPYQNNTEVKVSNDHESHSPIGRIDMSGKGSGSPYKIVAAADGWVRYIVDQHDGPSESPCKNNYVWIEHATGEWTKYSHMRQGSTTATAKLKVGQFVKAGTFLGYEGAVGCASGSHLHFEVGVPKSSTSISTTGGFLQDNGGSKRNRIPRICGISGGVFDAGKTYEARSVPGNLPAGKKEIAKHGVPERDYPCLIDQAVSAGYRPVWVDGFDVQGKVFFNAVFRPAGGIAWAARHGLTSEQYQSEFTQRKSKGYRPLQVDSYLRGGSVRYAAIFVKQTGPSFAAYHGRSAAEHQAKLDELVAKGYRPVNVSVVAPGGNLRYTALFEKKSLGSWQAKSFLSAGEYQSQFSSNAKAGRRLIYLNAYSYQGSPRFSAIWSAQAANGPARHGLSGAQYQSEWQKYTGQGNLTQAVSGYATGNAARYAAFWSK